MTSDRDLSIDLARGLIMVLMALDHTRIFFTSAQFDPVSVEQTNLAYFATRWVTHLCAPGFFFFAGLGAALAERSMSPVRSSMWLLTRGLWLIVLEFTLIAFAWSFVIGWSWLGVIWSLGASMICLAVLRWAPKTLLLVAACAMLALHNAFPVGEWIGDPTLSTILYTGGGAETPIGVKIALFPILPWLAMMMLGYASANWFVPEGKTSASRFALVGAAAIVTFVLIRFAGFGQPADGGAGSYSDWPRAVMSFFNVEKYPPSLQFTLVTLGVLFLFVAGVSRLKSGTASTLLKPLVVFGRTPLFFYVLHLFVVHALAFAAALALRWPTEYLFWRGVGPNLRPPEGYGFDLWGVYLAWFVVVALLYVPCAAIASLKSRSKAWWLRYV